MINKKQPKILIRLFILYLYLKLCYYIFHTNSEGCNELPNKITAQRELDNRPEQEAGQRAEA